MKIPRRAGRLLRIFGDFSIWLVWTPKGPQRPNVVLVVFDTLLSETGGMLGLSITISRTQLELPTRG